MMPSPRDAAWSRLAALAQRPGAAAIGSLFSRDADRFEKFHWQACDILLDLSKTAIDDAAMQALQEVAKAMEVLPHRVFPGDRPSTTLLLPRVDARTLGQLVALYEHKVFCLGALWDIDAFDQWGVELGKQLSTSILPELMPEGRVGTHDSSTAGLIGLIREWQGLDD
jgi:glucose-6-phosphate isomerase